MAFTPDPFSMTGTVDTTNYGAPADRSVKTVCPAFTDATLATDAANRVQPDQRSFNRTY